MPSSLSTCKYLFSANDTPPVANEEDCYAWYRRFIFADFNVTFTKENSTPRQELLANLSAPEVFSEILNWALDGLQELLRNGDVTERPTVEEIRLQYIRRSDTALAYFNDKVTITDNAENYVVTDVWFRDYVTYCHNKKIKPKTQGAFIGAIKQHLPGAEKAKIRSVPDASPLSAWRYVTFVPAVPGVPTSDTTISGTKKNEVQKKLNYEKLSEKVGTGGTPGTDSKRECGSQNNDLFDSHNWRFTGVSSWKNFEVLDNKSCLNAFYGLVCTHGKSPCFLALSFLMLLRVDCQTLILMDVHGDEFLD